MIIVSQDKDKIAILENIAHLFINAGSGTTISYGRMAGCSEELGYYDTKERAKAVLIDMVKAYSAFENIKHTNLKDLVPQTVIRDLAKSANLFDVYEMPES